MGTHSVWWFIIAVALTTAVTKAVGPIVTGGRDLPARLTAVLNLMAPALLAGLVVTHTLVDESGVAVGAATVGVAAGIAALLLRAPTIVSVLIAVAVTAIVRAL